MREFFIPLSGRLRRADDAGDEAADGGDGAALAAKASKAAFEQQYVVQHCCDAAQEGVDKVEDICDELSNNATGVLQSETFDPLYCVCESFSAAPGSAQTAILAALTQGLHTTRVAAEHYVAAKDKKGAAFIPVSVEAKEDSDADEADGDDGEGGLGGGPADVAASYRTGIKKYAFLLATIINHMEKQDGAAGLPQQPAGEDADGDIEMAPAPVPKRGGKKGGRAAAGAAKKASAQDGEAFDWSVEKERAIGGLVDLVCQSSMYSLWRMASPEEEFGGLLLGAGLQLLERVDNLKSKGVKEATFTLLATCLQRFPTLITRAVSQLVHALRQSEALATPLAELVALVTAKPYRLAAFLPELLDEIAGINGALLSKDPTGARALSSFLVSLAALAPRACLANRPALEAQLEAESYVMRNGCVQIIGQLIESMDGLNIGAADSEAAAEPKPAAAEQEQKQATPTKNKKKGNKKNKKAADEDEEADELEEQEKKAAKQQGIEAAAGADGEPGAGPAAASSADFLADSKKQLLAILHARIHDVSSFTRTKTLQQLVSVVRARALTGGAAYVATLRAAQDRLLDKTASVRRAAIQLLCALMEMNPFSPILSHELLQNKLAAKVDAFKAALIEQRKAAASQEDGGDVKMQEDDAASVASGGSSSSESSVRSILSSPAVLDLGLQRARADIEQLFHAANFADMLARQIAPVMYEMLSSKTTSDALEAVSFFVTAKQFNLTLGANAHAAAPAAQPQPAAQEAANEQEEIKEAQAPAVSSTIVTVESGCKKLSGLIWSSEPSLREAVLDAWGRLYLHPELTQAVDNSPNQKRAALVSAASLLSMLQSSSMSEQTSMEEVLTRLYHAGRIPRALVDTLWELFANEQACGNQSVQGYETRAAVLTLLNFFANADAGAVLVGRAQQLLEVSLSPTAMLLAPALVRAACVSLQKWQTAIKNAPSPLQAPPSIGDKTQAAILERLSLLLTGYGLCVRGSVGTKLASMWYSMMEQVLNTVFMLHATPESFVEQLMHQMEATLFTPSRSSAAPAEDEAEQAAAANATFEVGNVEKLSRFLFVLSHTAMRTLVHIDQLDKDIKGLKSRAKQPATAEADKKQAADGAGSIADADAAPAKGRGKGKKAAAPAKKKAAGAKKKGGARKKEWEEDDEEEEEEEEDDDDEAEEEEEEEEEEKPRAKKGGKKAAGKGKKAAATAQEAEEEESSEPAPAAAEPARAAVSSIEDELATVAAAEYELDQRRESLEADMIRVGATGAGLLSSYGQLVVQVASTLLPGSKQYGRFHAHPNLLSSAVLSLCKLMSLNVVWCEAHLRLLFSLLTCQSNAHISAVIKGNIIVALGDLFLRFPNSIEPYGEYMYHGLKKQGVAPTTASAGGRGKKKAAASEEAAAASSVYVRKNTLMVLTHLILNDMLKAKSPIAEIAKCTQVDAAGGPAAARIAHLSQVFFTELNSKAGDHSKATIYNILPDILSRLSVDAEVSSADFQAVFRFLLSFLVKDKQVENLIEKLLNRFENHFVQPTAPSLQNQAAGAPAAAVPATAENGAVPMEADPVVESASSSSLSSSASSVSSESKEEIVESSLKQCRDLSYCLTQLHFSLASVKKLSQLFRAYGAKLGDPVIFQHFMAIIARCRKNMASGAGGGAGVAAKAAAGGAEGAAGTSASSAASREKELPELKQLCDELEVRFTQAHEKLVEEGLVTAKARSARGKRGYGERVDGESAAEAAAAAAASAARDAQEGDEEESVVSSIRAPLRGGKKAAAAGKKGGAAAKKAAPAPKKKAPARRRKKAESSDDEEEEESDEEEEEVSDEE